MQPVCDDYFRELEPGGPASSQQLNPNVRAYLDAARAYLLGLHDAGATSRRVNEEHADLVDRLIRKLFRVVEDGYFQRFPRLNFRLAVVAVGGYGRRELSLGSDIDLLFLFRGKMNPYVETLAEAISQRLWDARLVVGAATRTLADCMRVGREDLPTLTSYLDARFLIGDPGLYAELDREVRKYLKQNASDFIRAKAAEREKRHVSYGESLYLLQPNVKESVGGLRDYHQSLWMARAVQWEVRRPEHLLLHGFIDAEELDGLLEALEFFWRVRNELHRRGRKDDRFHYAAQEVLVERLGIEGSGELLPIENLMRAYYAHARVIDTVCERVVDRVREIDAVRRGRHRFPPQPVAEGFVIQDGRLEIPSASLLSERPVRVLGAFAVAQHHDVDLSTRARRLVQQHVARVDGAFREDPEAAGLFRLILSAPARVYRTLKVMDEVDLLGAYLPEFGRVVGLWLHDLYHTYTVDVHSLFLVEQLRRIWKGNFPGLRLATSLMREVRDPFTLYLGCMLHDIGKGLGGGHSEKGARMVPAIAKRLGLDEAEAADIDLIVRHHLTMSAIAEQRDVNDPRQILKLGRIVGSRRRLRLLYLSTVADIRSVSSEAWTEWKAGLLEALYRNTAEWLEAGGDDESAERFFLSRAMRQAAETEREALAILESEGVDVEGARDVLASMPRHYLLHHVPGEVVHHMRAALHFLQQRPGSHVYSFDSPPDAPPFWGLVVLAPDRRGLFSTLAGALTSCGHNILAADAYTTRQGVALDVFRVDALPGGAAEEELERERVAERVERAMAGEPLTRPSRPRSGLPAIARTIPPTVNVSNDDSDFYSIVDVATNDRPALLHDITRAISELGLQIVMTRAHTRANRVTDAFYVTDTGSKLESSRISEVEERLLEAIRQGDDES